MHGVPGEPRVTTYSIAIFQVTGCISLEGCVYMRYIPAVRSNFILYAIYGLETSIFEFILYIRDFEILLNFFYGNSLIMELGYNLLCIAFYCIYIVYNQHESIYEK